MTYVTLDFYFPFIIMIYGFVMTFFLHSEFFVRTAQAHLSPEMYARWGSHRYVALICLVVGGFWSLQNALVAPFS